MYTINLVNGEFCTPKIKYLYTTIDCVNRLHNTYIKKLPLYNGNLQSNVWLAGFTDADEHFQISLEGYYGLNQSTYVEE